MGREPYDSASDIERELTKSMVASRLFADAASVQLGRFRLVRYLGHGAVGVVYEAIDPERGPVAIKLLGRADARSVYRVKQEFRAIAGLQHPNLIALHELVHEHRHWFFSMELIDGAPFDRWARAPGQPLDEGKLRTGLRQLADAVSFIHASGKLHRDLKPSNVLVTQQGVVKVLDFGLVSDRDEAASADTGLAGTPEYVAPEQAAGSAASPASDWYAVGVILHRVLTGRAPFEGDAFKVLVAKQRDAAPPIARPDVQAFELHALCEQLLVRDPERRAGARDVFATLDESSALPREAASMAPARPVFVGREAELATLRAATCDRRVNGSSLVLVGGPSGIGKSALLDRFASELGDEYLVLRGRCYEQESLPYKVFDAVIDALSRHLRTCTTEQVQRYAPRYAAALIRLFPVLGRVDALAHESARSPSDEPHDLRTQAFAAAKELLLRLTDHYRVVIMVDDLQWGDLDSARMMTRVLGPPDPPPVLFVGAFRDDERREEGFVDALLDERMDGNSWDVRRISLEPLPQRIAADLAGRLISSGGSSDLADVEQTALAVANESAGVPFFITELAARVIARRAVHEPYRAPASLEDAVLERIAAMPDACHELLEILVVASEPIEAKVALTAAGLSTTERSALGALRAARLVRSHGSSPGEWVEVYHDRIRSILSSRATPQRAREIHARIAQAMEQHGVRDPDRLLVHNVGAHDHAQAARTALSAADAAFAKLAFNRAEELYGRAIDLLPANDPQLPRLRVARGDALANAGRGARASEQYLLAARDFAPTEARELQLKAAQQCFKSGLTARGRELAEPLLRRHGVSLEGSQASLVARFLRERVQLRLERALRRKPAPPDTNGAERLATLGGLFQELMISDQLRGAILYGAFLRHALRQPDPLLQLKAQVWECVQTAWLGGKNADRESEAILVEVMRLRRQIETPYAQALEHLAASAVHQHAARYAVGFEHGRKARELFEQCPGTYWERAHSALVQFSCAEYVGDLRTITVAAPELARAAIERQDDGALMQVSFTTALIRLAHDEAEPTLAFLKNRFEVLGSPFSILHYLAIHRIVDCLIYMGRPVEALEFLRRHWDSIERMHGYRSSFIKAVIYSLRARATVSAFARSGDRSLCSIIDADLKRLSLLKQHGYAGMALALRGAMQYLEGDRDAAIASLELGVDRLAGEGIERFLHSARRRLGELLGGERGAELVAQADDAMRHQEVKRPELFTNVMMADLARPR